MLGKSFVFCGHLLVSQGQGYLSLFLLVTNCYLTFFYLDFVLFHFFLLLDVINSQPNILIIWEQKSPIYVGQNVEIFCWIVTWDPNTKYLWYRSDTNIWNEENLGVLIDPRLYEQPAFNGGNQEMAHVKFTLTLQNVTIDQSGLYGCRAENYIGYESRHTNLTVTHRSIIIPPVFAGMKYLVLTGIK